MPTNTATPLSKSELIAKAREVLSGKDIPSGAIRELCKQLESVDQFDYATELLLKRLDIDEKEGNNAGLRDYQTLAKYIYKDNSLPASFKFDKALQELNFKDDLFTSGNCESLGLAAAIYKRKWQFDHQYKHLQLSLFYYEKGFRLWQRYITDNGDLNADGEQNDQGYNGINYAYMLELMAVNEMEEIGSEKGAASLNTGRLHDAQATRKYILEQFIRSPYTTPELITPNPAPWVIATVAEAYFGLCRYKEARQFIDRYRELTTTKPWELRTFSQQIFSLGYLQQSRDAFLQENGGSAVYQPLELEQQVDLTGINDCLNALSIQTSNDKREIKKDGKTGLALSGGGFRASLFHIGVLAALAERDELRNIEVISCVSGGSIIGAYYYLKLKILLEEKPDEAITREDYIQIVSETEVDFLAAVQKNLRMRIFSNLGANFKMLRANYSRTNRLGELYEKHLYKPLLEKTGDKYKEMLDEQGNICINKLFITPPGNFNFSTDNWKRRNKVPQLVLNATSLNTGHNWRFTASYMGEPATSIIADVDVKSRLRRMYYRDAPEGYKNFRLGYAVGASSCVPVMFEPLPMLDLYPGIDLQLIDGGLHDNQGIAALIDEECRNAFISDASGQLPTQDGKVSGLFSLFMRSDNILQERLRELQFQDMRERRSTAQLNDLWSVHLKNGINAPAVNWKYCTDPPRRISYAEDTPLVPYGVRREVQQRISEIRTDLDAFHDLEAYALMHNGYVQAHYEMEKDAGPRNDNTDKKLDWQFLSVHEYVTDPAKADEIKDKLALSSKVFFKVYHHFMTRWVKIISLCLLLAAGAAFAWYLYNEFQKPGVADADFYSISNKAVLVAVVLAIGGMLTKWISIIFNPRSVVRKWVMKIGVAFLGWVLFNIYLLLFNPIYLALGKLKNKK
jgi:predicted acylesterase/phospholipase RssA